VRASQFFAQEFLFPIASPFLCRFVARQLKTWNVFETIESPPWQQTTHYPVPRFWEKGNLEGVFFDENKFPPGGCKSIECPAFRMQSQKLSKLPKANMPDDQRPTHQPINPPKPPSGNPLAYGLIELIEHWDYQNKDTTPPHAQRFLGPLCVNILRHACVPCSHYKVRQFNPGNNCDSKCKLHRFPDA